MKARFACFAAAAIAACFLPRALYADDEEAWSPPATTNRAAITDMRVEPFMSVKWGQGDVDGAPCYNALTPENRRTGCAATALAQVLRHYEKPDEALAPFSGDMAVITRRWPDPDVPGARFDEPLWSEGTTNEYASSSSPLHQLLDGTDGRYYEWAKMPLDPANAGVGDEERNAIGALCNDAAIALHPTFYANLSTNDINLGSIANGHTNTHAIAQFDTYPEITTAEKNAMADALRRRFGYANAYVYDMQRTPSEDHIGLHDKELFERIVNANLDAKQPVVLAFVDSYGHRHYAIADGYGYATCDDGEKHEYVHLNLGWEGEGDGWYSMPRLSTEGVVDLPICEAGLKMQALVEAVFNISPSLPGAVVSGRLGVMDDNGEFVPKSGLSVQVYDPMEFDTPYRDLVSVDYGVFSTDADFPAETNIFFEAHYDDPAKGPLVAEAWVKVKQTAADSTTHLVTSSNNVGNVWGCDLALSEPNALVDGVGYASLERALIAAEKSATAVPVVYITDEIEFGSIEWKIVRDMVICCTNDDPLAATILRPGSGKLVLEPGVRVLFTNVCFQVVGQEKPVVEVKDGATCAIGGKVVMDSIRVLSGGGIEVVSELDPDCYYIVDEGDSGGEGGVFARFTGTGDASQSASLFIHATDERLSGEAQPGGTIVWADKQPPDSAAVLKLDQDGEIVNYRSFEMLLRFATNDCRIIVLQDCPYTNTFTVTHRMEIVSVDGLRRVTSPRELSRGNDGFVVAAGGELVFADVTFSGHKGGEFVKVDGGEFVLDSGAVMEDIENTKTKKGGAVNANSGKVTVKPGAVVRDTRATCTGAMGGFVCVSPTGEIELAGGTITGCRAQTFGGAVYAAYGSPTVRAKVRVTGPAVIMDNTAYSQSTQSDNSCDVYIANDANPLELAGDATGGRIGLQYVTSSYVYSRNVESNMFAVVADGVSLDASQLEGSAAAFFNNTSNGLYAVVSETSTGLVWQAAHQIVHYPLDEADIALAKVRVTYLESGAVEYWEHVDWAFNSLTNDASVELLADDRIAEKVSITNNVVFFGASEGLVCSQTASGRRFDYVAGKFVYPHSVDIAAGASLVVRSLAIEDEIVAVATNGPIFNVEGELVLDGAVVSGVNSSATAGDCAVWVPHGGVFTMTNSAMIVNCVNTLSDPTSHGGSAIRSSGGTINLVGCSVAACEAAYGGALYFGGAATINIGGATTVTGNTNSNTLEPANLLLAATMVTLVSPLSGTVGITPVHGFGGSSNIFGRVALDYPEGLESVTNSAAHFLNDETGERGIAVTNADGEVYLAWSGAVGADGTFVDDHKVYSAIGEVEPAPQPPEPPAPIPAEPTPVDFTAIYSPAAGTWTLTLTNAVTGCRYFLYSTNSLVGGFVVPSDGSGAKTNITAAADGEFSFTVPASGDAAEYFKVVGLPEVIGE